MKGNLVLKCAKPMDDLIKDGIKDALEYFFPSPSAEIMVLNKPPTTALKFLAIPRHNLDGSDTDDMDLLNDLTAHPMWADVELWANPKFINLRQGQHWPAPYGHNGKLFRMLEALQKFGTPGIAHIDAVSPNLAAPASVKPTDGNIVGAIADETLRPELKGNEEARRLMQETLLDEAAFAAADAVDSAPPTRFAFQNVHKSRLTVHELLENLQNDIDFLFIQENPVSFIRNVPSSKREEGDPLIGPVHHRGWQCIEKTTHQESSQVAIYINTRFLDDFQVFPDFSPTIDPNVLAVTLKHNTIRTCSFTIVNVYNPPKTRHSAIHSLIEILPRLNDAVVIQGDFNLPSGIWDPARNNSSPLSIDLFNHLSDEGFGLCNDEGAPTWTNRRGSFSVLDLVFLKDSLAELEPDAFINMEGRGRSDHAIISLAFGTTEHWGRPYIPADEEEEENFVTDISKAILQSAIALSNSNDVEGTTELIHSSILNSWNRNSKTPRIGSSLVTWWTAECQHAKDMFLACRTRENQKAYDAATKKARTDFFN
ncbi:hypothetical protein AX14_005297 [Amanita brunnescens Koide BX004]|nr:hypothetical protein AX14_005297 [Amanita brunnescens Koide BX004]